ncbi:MAG TPA: hypothetical protein PLP23_15820 [Panacibacter sp.]|nr:hypothetical protein [Panacibacter sp.]
MHQSPFNYQSPVKPPIFISRDLELDFLRKNILYNNESVILSGLNAVGKSSTILTFLSELTQNENSNRVKIFSVRIVMTQFYRSLQTDFLSIMTHEMVANIWTKVLRKDYSLLLEETFLNPGEESNISKHINKLKRIYKIVSSESLSSKGETFNEIGGKAIISGKISNTKEYSMTRKPLQTFEFMLLLDELMEILSDFGYTKILFFCDDLNHLPPNINYDLFSTYLDVFSSKQILFAFTANDIKNNYDSSDVVDMNILINSFGKNISIGPFSSKEEVNKLICNSLSQSEVSEIEFDDDCQSQIFDITEGYPYFIARLCDNLFFEAYTNKIDVISSTLINKYTKPFTKALEFYKQHEGRIPVLELKYR